MEVPLDRYRRPVLVSGTDGVGTKLRLAIDTGRHDKIGIDLVAMCANDIAVSGAEPLFFLDYYATGKLRVDVAEAVIRGIAEGCELAGAALVGGETAEMPGMYHGDDYDLAGFCVGVVERDCHHRRQPHRGRRRGHRPRLLRPSLQRLFADPQAGVGRRRQRQDPARGQAAVRPPAHAHAHLREVDAGAGAASSPVKGFAHITGGGLTDNIPRVLPDGMEVVLQRRSWARDPVFDWLATTGRIAAAEMYRTFNCGIGMIAVVAPADVDARAGVAQRAAARRPASSARVARGTRGVVIEE